MSVTGVFCWALFAVCTQVSYMPARLDVGDVALRLDMTGGTCSGTAVAKDVILTAAHCLQEENSLSFVNNIPVVTIETIEDGSDHVLIRISGLEFKRWAKIGPLPEQADRVRWIGNPDGLSNMYREGYIVRVDKERIYIDAQGWMGDSGAGLFNDRGRLVGVLSGVEGWELAHFSFQLTVAYPLNFTPEQLKKMGTKYSS